MRFAAVVLMLGCGPFDPGGVSLDAGAQHCYPVHDAGGPFVSSSLTTVWEEEPHLAADGTGNVIAAFIDIFPDHNSEIGYAVSHDDGASWTKPAQIDVPNSPVGSDPSATVDSHGNFYVAWVGYRHDLSGNTMDMHIYVSRLDRQSNVLLAPVEASAGGNTLDLDKPWITTDANDDLLVTWEESTNGNVIALARSSDGGLTFSRAVVAAGAGEFLNLAFPCLDHGSGVPLYVVANASQHATVLFASPDHGASFTRTDLASDAVFADPTCVARGNDVWVSYDLGAADFIAARLPAAQAVRVMHSGDRGVTFDHNVLVSNGPPGTQYLLATLALGPALELIYYQGELGGVASLHRATSPDGGLVWLHDTLAQSGQLISERSLPCFPGDYIGSVVAAGSLYIAYSDNTNGRSHTAFLRTISR